MIIENTTPITIEDVGILLIGYNRPEMLTRRLNEIERCKIANLYVSIDGGEKSNSTEMENFKKFAANKMESVINFNLMHQSINYGLVRHLTSQITFVLEKHNYVIVIEDDVKISSSFILNMISGLNYQRQSKLSGIVCGWSPVSSKLLNNKWRKGKYPFAWGWACSREFWANYNFDLSNEDLESSLMSARYWKKLSKSQRENWLYKFSSIQQNPLETWDTQLFYYCITNNLDIQVPLFSLTGNEGFDDKRAVHTKGEKPKVVNNDKLSNKIISNRSLILFIFVDIVDKYFFNDLKIVKMIRSKILNK